MMLHVWWGARIEMVVLLWGLVIIDSGHPAYQNTTRATIQLIISTGVYVVVSVSIKVQKLAFQACLRVLCLEAKML